jgi:hypothetical protein
VTAGPVVGGIGRCSRAVLAGWLLLLAGGCGMGEAAADHAALPATVTVSMSNDGRGGLALLAGYVNNLRQARARDGGAVLRHSSRQAPAPSSRR